MLIDSFPNIVIQSAMWMVGKWDITKKTKKGDYDKVIKQYAAWAKSTNRPIYLRIGYEFDGPHNQLEPKKYVILGFITNITFSLFLRIIVEDIYIFIIYFFCLTITKNMIYLLDH
mgnify:CR=1 FL=1